MMESFMPSSRVIRKGQITIPQEYREILSIREGDSVHVALQADTLILRRTVPWSELAGSLHQFASLVPEDESGLKIVTAEAWVADEPAPGLDDGDS
jgi:AbrB family looped-hinge helix DNA binding protein